MQDIYAMLSDEIVGTCNTLFSLGYYLNVESHFLLLLIISKHATTQKVLGLTKH